MRSIERDVKAMSLGLDVVNQELYEARKHLIDNPEKANELIQRL